MEDILKMLASIPSTCAADATEGLNNLDPAIKPLKQEYTICGRAVTVKMPAGDNLVVLKAIRAANPGDILVIDAKGYTSRAVAGDFVAALAQLLGVGGMVVDGSIRDVISIKNSGFPVFCRTATASASVKGGGGAINVPIACGGISVNPGDIIIGDADGVVVIPRERELEIAAAAQNKLLRDRKRAETVLCSPDAAKAYLDELLTEQ
jgi:regulator of RNase E activity RraA